MIVPYYLRHFSVPRVLRCPTGTDRGCLVISGFRRHLGLTDKMPDKMNLVYHKLLYCEFHEYEVMTMSVIGGQPKKHANPSYKAIKHMERTFLISTSLLLNKSNVV